MIKGWDLDFFNSGEWQVCDEKLKDLERLHRPVNDGYNPGRSQLFAALRATSAASCKVMVVGQDPYPGNGLSTGLAFNVRSGVLPGQYPPTLRTLFNEYASDLGRPFPSQGSLDRWAERGVLLWNTVPSCGSGKSLSHDWPEWKLLTREIITRLAKKGIVFALLGQVARRNLDCISVSNNHVILTSHPSPRGSSKSYNPFVGSRLFSTINDKLRDLALPPVDWTLP